jgi:hypothetical protein
MRFQATEFGFVEEAVEMRSQPILGTRQKRVRVSRKVKILHTKLRVFDLYFAISRGRFVWTITSRNQFDLWL